MTDEKTKPRYYDLLFSLLDGISINRSIKERIMGQYQSTPNDFEADWIKMERRLRAMQLRVEDSEYISLQFHSQVHGIPENQLLMTRGSPIQTRMMTNDPRYSGPVPHDAYGNPVVPPSQPQEKDNFMSEIRDTIKEAQKMRIIENILGAELGGGNNRQQQSGDNSMDKMLPWMMMMNPNVQVQTKMTTDPNTGEQRVQGFTVVPQSGGGSGGTDLLGTLFTKMLEKDNTTEQFLLQSLLQNKDNEVSRLKAQRDAAYNETGIERVAEDMKRIFEIQNIVNPQAKFDGNLPPELALQMQEVQMNHELKLSEMNTSQAEVSFRNQLALREYVDSRKEKTAQMDMARQALGAVSDNIGKIVTDVAAPVSQAVADGMLEGAKMRTAGIQPNPQPVQGQSQQEQEPNLSELSDQQIMEAMHKAKTVHGQMNDYMGQFTQEIQKRQTAKVVPVPPSPQPVTPHQSVSPPVSEVDTFSEPVPVIEVIEEIPEPNMMGIDLDPNDFTVTE